jgi:alpha-glucoside transport system substrate-binding protein
MVARRTILRAGALAPVLAGCAPGVLSTGSGAVRIAVPWSGDELRAFRRVLGDLGTAAPGDKVPIDVVPLGDEIDSALSARGRSAPEIVMLPTVGGVAELAGSRLKPVAADLWHDDGDNRGAGGARLEYRCPWQRLLWSGGTPYAVPFKAAAKSLVWYDREAFPGEPDAPQHWMFPQWHDRRVTGRALLALGAADGWVLADMFENVLYAESADDYRALEAASSTRGGHRDWGTPGVHAAFTRLAELWGAPGILAGGVAGALTRQFPDAVRAVFEHRLAAMVVAPDFAAPIVHSAIARAKRSGDAVGVLWFPPTGPGLPAPRLGGGDVIVTTTDSSPAATKIIAGLAAPNAARSWVADPGGFLVPHRRTVQTPGAELKPLAPELNRWNGFGLADLMGPAGRRNGLWHVLTDLLKSVGTGGGVDEAARRAVDAMKAVEENLG